MSTILKTLKKLEEEKSVLDQGVDLKRLVLQAENPPSPVPREDLRKIGLGATLLLGGALLGGIVFFVLSPAKHAPQPLVNSSKPAPAVSSEPVDMVREIPSGIPLSNILDREIPKFPSPQESRIIEEEVKEEPVEQARAQTPAQEVFDMPQELEGIGRLIAPSKRPAQPQPVARSGYIPGMKVKGIIFFGEDNPSNHIFISTADKNNLKMKVGDTVLGASLQSIQSSRAVFSFRNKQIEIGIGE